MGKLTDKDRRLLRLSTAIVIGEWEEVRTLRRAAPEGEPDRAWREAALQTHLFAGFPRLVQAWRVLDEEGGLGETPAAEVERGDIDASRGRALFATIYGDDASSVRGMLDSHHPDFGDWILEHAYARVLARPGLAADRRELLASCALAAFGQDRQLASHARGSLRCGASFEELWGALDAVADLVGTERIERARRIVERFR
jgi:alkylhydroperoxidase/carboxymuconolactone decarboxylase family protein YurZ